jgi:hypothetical protein
MIRFTEVKAANGSPVAEIGKGVTKPAVTKPAVTKPAGGRPLKGEQAMTAAERARAYRGRKRS